MDLDLSPAFEDRLVAHKVVTTPRGRLVGSDGVEGSPRRPRSLSAPRTRQRAADLVNNLYERMGVSYSRGQATGLTASPMIERPITPGPFISRPTTPSNVVVATPSNSHTVFQRSGDDDANNFGEITQSRSFHDRYRIATARGRALDRGMTNNSTSNSNLVEELPNEVRSRSLSRGRVAKRWPPVRSEEAAAPPVTLAQTKPAYSSPSRLSSRPSWMESPTYNSSKESSNNSLTRSVEAEEKKEDSGSVSLKDRISVFGTKKGATSKAARTRPTRSVDPKYAAQFAVRDHPPKIDIYAEAKDPTATSETTDSSTGTPTTNHDPNKSQQHPPQPSQLQTSQSSPSVKKLGSIAMAYMSAIQSPSKSPKSTSSATNNKSSNPPREIAVSAATSDLGLHPNDSQSLAGLSTVSGDEFSNTPGKTTSGPARRPNWRNNQASKNQVQSYSNTVASMPAPPLTSSEDVALERLVEHRVKERMADLENKIENRLRKLVGAMEERVMARLDSIEQKMVHEI